MRQLKKYSDIIHSQRRQDRLLQFLHDTVVDILNRRDVMDLLETILNRAAELIGTSTGCALLSNTERTERIRMIATGAAIPFLGSRESIESGIGGKVTRTGKVFVVNDYRRWTERCEDVATVAEAVAYFPLKNDNEIIGVIGLWHTEPGRIFDRQDIIALEQFASLASVAYTNTHLHWEAEREIAESKQAKKLQQALYQISQTANSACTQEELYHSMHRTINELIPARNIFFAIYDEETGALQFPYSVDERRGSYSTRPLKKARAEYVLRTGQPFIINPQVLAELVEKGDVVAESQFSDEWLGVPLKNAAAKVLGVLAVHTYDAAVHFTEEHARILTFVSHQVAMSIERKEAEKKLRFLSMYDPVTGLYNRTFLNEELRRLEYCIPLSMIICDIDGLKLVNDTLGHSAGDELLISAAAVISAVIDTQMIAARLGGDEFAVLLPNANERVADYICSRIRQQVKDYNEQTTGMPLSLSLGFATRCSIEKTLQELYKEADSNMYQEKMNRSSSVRSDIVNTVMKLLETRDSLRKDILTGYKG